MSCRNDRIILEIVKRLPLQEVFALAITNDQFWDPSRGVLSRLKCQDLFNIFQLEDIPGKHNMRALAKMGHDESKRLLTVVETATRSVNESTRGVGDAMGVLGLHQPQIWTFPSERKYEELPRDERCEAIVFDALACCIDKTSLPELQKWLDHGKNMDLKQMEQEKGSFLIRAIDTIGPDQLRLPLIRHLVEGGQCDVNMKGRRLEHSPLIFAVIKGATAVVQLLVNAEAVDVDHRGGCGWTALIHAIETDQPDMVRILLDSGRVHPDTHDANRETPLLHAVRRTGSGTKIVQILLDDKRVNVNAQNARNLRSVLVNAIRQKNIDAVKLLLRHEGLQPEPLDEDDNVPMWHAISSGSVPIVKMMLETKWYAVNECIQDDCTVEVRDRNTPRLLVSTPSVAPEMQELVWEWGKKQEEWAYRPGEEFFIPSEDDADVSMAGPQAPEQTDAGGGGDGPATRSAQLRREARRLAVQLRNAECRQRARKKQDGRVRKQVHQRGQGRRLRAMCTRTAPLSAALARLTVCSSQDRPAS